jgi:glycosyltransferase involved in cell wall biosynthesis
VRNTAALKRALSSYATTRLTQGWAKRFFHGKASGREFIFYTWWFDATTLGLALAGRATAVPVIARAHGYDLYESRHRPPYIPFRHKALAEVTAVYADSQSGAQYLIERYPDSASKIKVARLGVRDPGFINSASRDGTFRMLSCSFLLPVKRIGLAIRGVAKLAAAHSNRRFTWAHIGTGPERGPLAELAKTIFPDNVAHRFIDYPGREALLRYYETEPIDLFINVSESEGTPVSVMEAISVGIPVMATGVGGNKEIVDASNGILLSPNPDPAEISATISTLLNDTEALARLRCGSRAKWQASYSAQKNYSRFVQSIQEL